jgi:hypothetical protein
MTNLTDYIDWVSIDVDFNLRTDLKSIKILSRIESSLKDYINNNRDWDNIDAFDFLYTHNGTQINRTEFNNNVPLGWMLDLDHELVYDYRGYKAQHQEILFSCCGDEITGDILDYGRCPTCKENL